MRTQGTTGYKTLFAVVMCIVQLSLISAVVAGQASMPADTGEDSSIHLKAEATGPGKPLVHFWSKVVGAGRAKEGLEATWQEELATAAKDGGFQYVRFHGIFQDDMFVYREDRLGNPIYNFQYVDDLYDRMLAKGVRPFVELSFSPAPLSPVHGTTFWWRADGSPPSDYNKWADLVHAFVQHCIDRYESLRSASGILRCGTSRTCMNRFSAADRSRSISNCTRSPFRRSRQSTLSFGLEVPRPAISIWIRMHCERQRHRENPSIRFRFHGHRCGSAIF